jgi:hypothetical protein
MATPQLIVPTAINLVTAINENIRLAHMRNQDAQLVLPTMFERARMIYDEKGVLPVQTATQATSTVFTK